MPYAEIDWELCKICEDCFARLSCNTRAIVKFDPDEPAVIETGRCNGCGKCLPVCPFSAILLIHPAKILRDPN